MDQAIRITLAVIVFFSFAGIIAAMLLTVLFGLNEDPERPSQRP